LITEEFLEFKIAKF